MKFKLILIFSIIFNIAISKATPPISDTIMLELKHVEGRWIQSDEVSGKESIFIFRDDYTFHKADNSGELLFFNVAGKYQLVNDTIKIFYQDFSRQSAKQVKVKIMYMQVIALSENELNINCTENKNTKFIRLRRQNKE